MTPRSAGAILHRQALNAARLEAIWAAIVAVTVVGCWLWFAHGRVTSILFLGVGLVLLWSGGVIRTWWELRTPDALLRMTDPEAIAAAQRAQEAHAAAVAAHQARVAARRPLLSYGLLGVIAGVSVLQFVLPGRDAILLAGLVKPSVRVDGEWWRLLTATYLHAGFWHLWMNGSALRALGPMMETYAPPLRLPLVYLVSAVGGSVASTLWLSASSVGASGGILGLVGFLLVLARRQPEHVPPWLARGALTTLALTAFLGVFGLAFIDNAAHGGGAASGMLLGLYAIPRRGGGPLPASRHFALDVAGAFAAAILVLGAAVAVTRLLQL